MSKQHSLSGRVIAITGGARGIGLATAKALIAQGAQVSIGDIDADLAASSAQKIGAFSAYLDVRDSASFRGFIASTEHALGPIYALINNAGIMPMGYFLDEPEALSNAQIDINFRGVMHGMQAVLPSLLARNEGHIINVASLAGRFSIPGAAVYCGTKFAVVGMTEAVAGEYRDSGVEFSMIMPSKVLTELTAGTDEASRAIPSVTPEAVADAIVDVLKKPRLHVAVPDYLRHVTAAYSIVPGWLQQTSRRLLGDDGILKKINHDARQGYAQRLQGLADVAKKSTKIMTKKPAKKSAISHGESA